MSSPIGPGDWVECFSSASRPEMVGQIFAVIEVRTSGGTCPCHGMSPFGLRLVGVSNSAGRTAFCGLNFRPIYRPKSEIIDALKQPAPERELDDA